MSEFHHVPFDSIGEAASFVAALARQIAAPRIDLQELGSVKIGVAVRGAGADVYLDANGLLATERAFGPPPNDAIAPELPSGIVWIVADRSSSVLGRNDVLREVLGDPPGPLHIMQTTIGTVKWWRDDKGYGLITSEETGPWDIWCHFAAIQGDGFRSLSAGERVEIDYCRTVQDSFRYIARRVRRIDKAGVQSG